MYCSIHTIYCIFPVHCICSMNANTMFYAFWQKSFSPLNNNNNNNNNEQRNIWLRLRHHLPEISAILLIDLTEKQTLILFLCPVINGCYFKTASPCQSQFTLKLQNPPAAESMNLAVITDTNVFHQTNYQKNNNNKEID